MFNKSKQEDELKQKHQHRYNFLEALHYIMQLYAYNQELLDLVPIPGTNYSTSVAANKTFNRLAEGGVGGELEAEMHVEILRKRFSSLEDQYNKGWNDCLEAIQEQFEKKIGTTPKDN